MRLVERLRSAAEAIGARAPGYDRDATFPVEDIEDFQREGWLLATLDEDDGGVGFGFHGRAPSSFFIITEHLAMASPATAHCLQVHLNTLQMLRAFCKDDLLERFVAPTRERSRLLVGAGTEPNGAMSTLARKVEGGWIINGRKHYATNATHADWIWLWARTEDGGDCQFMVAQNSPGLKIDASNWNPMGMRACVSPMLYLDDVFVPNDCALGDSGAFLANNWLGKINLGFTANYIGAARGMYDWIVSYLRKARRPSDPLYQVMVGELNAKISAARLMFYNALELIQRDFKRGLVMSAEAKYLAMDAVHALMTTGNQVAGSTALSTTHPIERLMRDMHVHLLHKRREPVIRIVGQSLMGEPFFINT